MAITSFDQFISSLPAFGGLWECTDAVGSGTFADSSGSGNAATVEGFVTFGEPGFVVGTPGDTAAFLDGTSGYGKTNWKTSTMTSLSVMAFFELSTLPDALTQIIGNKGPQSNAANAGFNICLKSNNELEAQLCDGTNIVSLTTSSALAANTPYCAELVWTGSVATLVLNGSVVASSAYSTTLPASTIVVGLGSYGTGDLFPGTIGYVGVAPGVAWTSAQQADIWGYSQSYFGGAQFTASAPFSSEGLVELAGSAQFAADVEMSAEGLVVVSGCKRFTATAQMSAEGTVIPPVPGRGKVTITAPRGVVTVY